MIKDLLIISTLLVSQSTGSRRFKYENITRQIEKKMNETAYDEKTKDSDTPEVSSKSESESLIKSSEKCLCDEKKVTNYSSMTTESNDENDEEEKDDDEDVEKVVEWTTFLLEIIGLGAGSICGACCRCCGCRKKKENGENAV